MSSVDSNAIEEIIHEDANNMKRGERERFTRTLGRTCSSIHNLMY